MALKSARHRVVAPLMRNRTVTIFVAMALILGAVGIAVSIRSRDHVGHGALPGPLSGAVPLSSPPAADATIPRGRIVAVPAALAKQLAADRDRLINGKKHDLRHVQVLSEGRTENDTVFLNADGTKTLQRSYQATSYKQDGQWKAVDSSLSLDPISGEWMTKANAWQARFGPISGIGAGVELTKGGQAFAARPVDAGSALPSVSGTAPNQILKYADVWPDIDLMYQVYGSEIKETIVVKSRVAVSSFAFDVSGAHLSPVAGRPGSFNLDGALADVTIPAPTVATADGGVVGADPIVRQTVIGNRLTISVDRSWLQQQANSAFPLAIDPGYQVGTNNNYVNYKSDGFVCNAGQGCGNSTGNASNLMWRFMFHVDLSQMQGKYVVGASLHLEMPNPDGVHYWGVYDPRYILVDHAGCFGFNCVDGSYGEAVGLVGSVGDFDVTGLFRNAVNANDMGSWMMARGEENWNYPSYKLFGYDRTIVTFNYDALPTQSIIASGAPATGGASVSTQPSLISTAATDPDNTGPVVYRYTIGTSMAGTGGGQASSLGGIIADSNYTTLPQWTVPDNVLQDGTTYYWQVQTWDSYGGAANVYSPVYSFKVDLRNGNDSTQAFDAVGPISIDLATGNLTTGGTTHSIAALGGSLGVGLDYNSPQRSRQGLVAQYWNNTAFTGAPTLTRVEPNINYNWNLDSPSLGVVPTDNFGSRWMGYLVAPYTGTYTFGCRADDYLNIKLNNLTVASGGCYNTTVWGTPVNLVAGQVLPFFAEHAEATGPAYAQVYARVTNGAQTLFADNIAPSTWFQTGVRPIATPHGLIGRYYTDDGSHTFPADQNDATRIFLSRTDTSMSMIWGTGSPVPNGPIDNFMVRWSGYFTAPIDDTYTFGAASDDGVRITLSGSNVVLNSWADHGAAVQYGNSVSLNANQTVPITVEYYEHGGGAQMVVYVKQASLPGAPDTVMNSNWLSPVAQVLPDGWSLGVDADGNLGYDYATIGQNSVVLRDATGDSHEYKFVNGGFTPPVNEDGQMVRNGDGTITLQDSDGRTYIFNTDGTLKLSTTPADDRSPAALRYLYAAGTNSAVPHLTQITDGVTTSRWAKVWYTGEAGCIAPPAGFFIGPANMICAVETSDGQKTQLAYSTDGRLARLIHPGTEISDYGYDTLGRIVSMRDSVANDAITAGVRAQDNTVLTEIAYDPIGRATSVTMPAATTGATRQAHTYDYQSGYTLTHIAGATEPSGFGRKVAYDGTYRTTDDTDVANLTTHTDWDTIKDLTLAKNDPTGLRATTLYDYADRPTDQYGPAPSTWFGADRTPLATNIVSTPHTQTGYDESVISLGSAYYNVGTATNGTGVATKLLEGAPKLHGTGIGGGGDLVKTWNAAAPITADAGKGWGLRASGDIHLTSNGNYNFRLYSDDGVRLWIDDNLVVDDWTDGAPRSHLSGNFINAAGDSWHRMRLDYYNKAGDTDAILQTFMTPPGGAETASLGSLLKPHYGLTTSRTTYDSSAAVGNVTSTTNYGANPELGLTQSANLDAAGLNYTSSSTYEAQGAAGSYLRQLTKTLPGGTTTNYGHYTSSDTADNPCTAGTTEAYKQAGMLKLKTEADPDGAGPQLGRKTETIYDDAGRVVATRYNADPWTCTTYDARGRVVQVQIPSVGGQPARTVTNNWAVGGNPLVVSSSDTTGTITTRSDLLGRTTSYTDALSNTTTTTYDALGRLASRNGPLGLEQFVYDNLNRLTSQKLNGNEQAVPSYDPFGRLASVNYPTAGALAQSITRDNLGRTVGQSYTLGNGSAGPSDTVTRSQSGQIVSGTELGQGKSYTYDKAGRLVAATIGSHTYAYTFGTPTGCSGTYNSAAGKNANRTAQTVDGVATSFCYDYADRLISSTDPTVANPIYDAHGNTISIGATAFGYDSSDRNLSITEGTKSTTFTRDVQNRVTKRVVTSPSSTSPLPPPWTTTSVAAPDQTGTSSYTGGTFTVSGNGGDIWDNGGASVDDEPQITTRTLTGDGQIVARVTSQINTDGWAKAGLIIKNTLTTGSEYAAVMVTPENGVRMQDSYNSDTDGGSFGFPNAWLKLVRSGGTITGYKSSNGTTWTQIGTAAPGLSTTTQVGLFVVAGNPALTTGATFDNVSVTQTGSTLPSGWANGDIGTPDIAGTASASGSTVTVTAAGTDVWDGDDQFHLAYQTLTGDGQIVARVKSQTNTGDWAKGGIVIKDSVTPGSNYASIHVTPTQGVRFQSNYTNDVDGGSYTFPDAWLKLVRSGNTIVGYKSADGTTWTQVSSATVSLGSTALVGLMSASTDPGALSTVTFDNVNITQAPATSEYRYGFTGAGDTPDLLLDSSNNIVEKYLQLPGGVIKTYRGTTSRVFSLPNVHGDAMATTNEGGTQTGTFQYDPFGNAMATKPDNTSGGSSFGWVGQHQKDTETAFTLQPTEMGARVYLTMIGRFLQVDPVEGGTENNYVYPPDPVNSFDLDGNLSFGGAIHWMGSHADAIGIVGAGLGFAACVVATAGICLAAGIATAAIGGVATGAQEYNRSGNIGNAVTIGAISGGAGMVGLGGGTTAIRYFGAVAGKARNYSSLAKAIAKAPARARAIRLLLGVRNSQILSGMINYVWGAYQKQKDRSRPSWLRSKIA